MTSDRIFYPLRTWVASCWRCLLVLFGVMVVTGAGEAPTTALDPTRLGAEQTAMLTGVIERMRLRLWTVSVIADDGIPTGWHALSGGIHLRAMSVIPPADECWVLPPDWVGIRQPAAPGEPDYEVFRRSGLLIALRVPEGQSHLRTLLRELLPGPLSDENREQTAAQRTQEMSATSTRQAQALIARFCPDGSSLRAAIDSLSELRIPAYSVFADGIRSTDATVVHAAIYALGDLGGSDATTLLLPELLRAEDTRTAVNRKGNAARALLQIADPACGPALLAALPQVHDQDALLDVVETLERIEYRPAGDAVLALLKQTTARYPQGRYAKAVASLRHQPAIPFLRQLCGDATLSGTNLFQLREPSVMGGTLDRRPEIALLRLTAPWCEAVDGIRLLLVPMDHTTVGKDCRIALVIENQSAKERIDVSYLADGVLTINGVRHSTAPGGFMGTFPSINHHGIWLDDCDLKPFITAPGTYRISYSTDKATSNEVLVEIGAAPMRGK